jgi:hypothetical protein
MSTAVAPPRAPAAVQPTAPTAPAAPAVIDAHTRGALTSLQTVQKEVLAALTTQSKMQQPHTSGVDVSSRKAAYASR